MASQEQKKSMGEALLKRPLQDQPPEPEDREGEGARISPVTMTGFMFLTFSFAMAVSLWDSGFGAVFFLVFACLDLAMLCHCLRLYARTPPGSPRRELLKMAAWVLATILTVTFIQLLELWVLIMGTTENPMITDSQNQAA